MSSFGNNGSNACGGTGSSCRGGGMAGRARGGPGECCTTPAAGRLRPGGFSRRSHSPVPFESPAPGPPIPRSEFFEQYITILFSNVHLFTFQDENIYP